MWCVSASPMWVHVAPGVRRLEHARPGERVAGESRLHFAGADPHDVAFDGATATSPMANADS